MSSSRGRLRQSPKPTTRSGYGRAGNAIVPRGTISTGSRRRRSTTRARPSSCSPQRGSPRVSMPATATAIPRTPTSAKPWSTTCSRWSSLEHQCHPIGRQPLRFRFPNAGPTACPGLRHRAARRIQSLAHQLPRRHGVLNSVVSTGAPLDFARGKLSAERRNLLSAVSGLSSSLSTTPLFERLRSRRR